MSESPVPRDPGRDENSPGTPADPGDRPSLGSPGWRLVPQSPDWDETYLAAAADDEDPDDLEEYEDPDNAPPPRLDDCELAALIAEADEVTAGQARAEALRAALGHTAVMAAVGAVATGRRGPGMPVRRRPTPASSPARRPGSAPASRSIPPAAAPHSGRSWKTPPVRMTGTPAPPMMSWPG